MSAATTCLHRQLLEHISALRLVMRHVMPIVHQCQARFSQLEQQPTSPLEGSQYIDLPVTKQARRVSRSRYHDFATTVVLMEEEIHDLDFFSDYKREVVHCECEVEHRLTKLTHT